MKHNLYYRKNSLRLKRHDYASKGIYFVTICSKNKLECFGKIKNGIMGMNQSGILAYSNWLKIIDHFMNVKLDEYIIMPNHIHGIIIINQSNPCRGGINPAPTGMGNDKKKTIATITPDINPMGKKTVSEIIRWFKGRTTYDIHQNEDMSFMWQRSFHDKIIKNNKELKKVRQYIRNNPQQWECDRNNPKFKGEWITGKTNVLK